MPMENKNILNYGKTPAHTVFKLSWPAIVEQFLICLVSLVDMAMVGSIGASATAAVAITAPVIWLTNGINSAICIAFMFITARFIGEGKFHTVHNAVRQAVFCAFVLGILITAVTSAISGNLPMWMGAEKEVLSLGVDYFRPVALSLFTVTVATTVSGVMRAAGNTKLPLFANIGANILNVIGNFLLIYETRVFNIFGTEITVFGAGMGVAGAAVSTSLSRVLLAAFLLVMLYTQDTPVKITLKGNYFPEKTILRDALKIGVPVCVERCCLNLGQIALTSMISGLGTVALAVHHLTNEIEGIFYLPAYGLADSATALIGQSLGAKEEKLAEKFASLVCIINIIAIAVMCIPVFIWAKPVLSIFSNNTEVIYQGTVTLRLAAAFEVPFSLYIVINGILRGAGDVKTPLAVALIGIWVIRLASCYFLAYILEMGVAGIWLGIGIDSSFRGIFCALRLKSGKWKYAWKG